MKKQSDLGVVYTDKKVKELENAIRRVYAQAQKDIEKKTSSFFASSADKEKKLLAKVKAGEMTQEAFDKWRTGQAFIGNQWKEKEAQIASTLAKANQTALSLINGQKANVFAFNGNYEAYKLEHGAGANFGFDLYNTQAVSRLLKDKPNILPFKKLDRKKDETWNWKNIRGQITQGIVQGESIPKIAKRMADVTGRNMKQSTLYARTAMTSAQNAGRQARIEEAEELGIKVQKVWIAVMDDRTRDLHADLDGQTVDPGELFEVHGYKIEYPGDPHAAPEMVYNCRCTLGEKIKDYPKAKFDRRVKDDDGEYEVISNMTYREWEESKRQPEEPEHRVVEGNDISETWVRRSDQFNFAIEDVINAQGFDGVPRVVSRKEFDDAVKESSFIAQRTYSAPDQETLNAYRDQLYNGKWYVDCSTGGAQYGQGMYCASDYTGKLSDGIKEEMAHYKEIGESRFEGRSFHQKVVDVRAKDAEDEFKKVVADAGLTNTEDLIFRANKLYKASDDEIDKAWDLMASMTKEERSAINQKLNALLVKAEKAERDILDISIEDYAKKKGIELYAKPVSYIETFTLDPSAKIISFNDLQKLQEKIVDKMVKEKYGDKKGFVDYFLGEIEDERIDEIYKMDRGAFATLMGYDVINAEGHGESGSYSVILNRTKLIILGE